MRTSDGATLCYVKREYAAPHTHAIVRLYATLSRGITHFYMLKPCNNGPIFTPAPRCAAAPAYKRTGQSR